MALSKKTTNTTLSNDNAPKAKGKKPHIKVRIRERGQKSDEATFVSCWGQGLTQQGQMKFSGKIENTFFDLFLDDQYYTEDYDNILAEAEAKAAKLAKK